MNPDLGKESTTGDPGGVDRGRNRSLSRDPGEVVQRGHASGEKRVFGSGGLREDGEPTRVSERIQSKRIQTRVGELRLEIPQVRGLRFYPKSLERGCRSEKALKLAIAEMYVMGVSTRKVTEITEQLCGLEISATQVSRVAGMLDEELEEFRSRELGEYPIVYLDAHYEKVRRGGRVQDVAILKAIAVNRLGTREVLGSERQDQRSGGALARVFGGSAQAGTERGRAVGQ